MARRLCVLAVVLVATACGSSDSTPAAPSPTQASITATASPNPVTATVCSPPCAALNGNSYQFRADGTLTIQETAGIGGNIDSITVTNFNLVFTSTDIVQRSGTSRVVGKGMLLFPLNFVYGLAGTTASRSTVFPITVAFTDDRGNHLTVVMQWAAN
jgi:hypothetical protein